MTTKEFSAEFDVLLNSYSPTQQSLNLDEYEKSVFLTSAQEQVIIGLYNGTLKGEGVENTEELRRYLDNLVETSFPTEITATKEGLEQNSKFYQLPDNLLFITYESVDLTEGMDCADTKTILVKPVKQDEYNIIKNNPFKGASKRRVLRLDCGNNSVELISKYLIDNYHIRYIKKPSPIILIQLEDTLSIDGETKVTECTLHPALHRLILKMAVQLAAARLPQLQQASQ